MNHAITGIELPDLPRAEEAPRSPGASLATRRAERSLSLQDVAQRLKYGVRQIEALEQDDYSRLPGTTFVRGMIRSYAKLLDTDAAPLLRELERRHIPAQVSVDLRAPRIPFPDGSKRGTRVYGALSVLVVVAAAAVVFEWQFGRLLPWNEPDPKAGEFQSSGTQPAAATVQQDAVSRTPPEVKSDDGRPLATVDAASFPPPAHASVGAVVRGAPGAGAGSSRGRIVLKFERESWVEIKQADGRTLMSQINRAGTEQEIGGAPPFVIVIGNAPSVRLLYNGQPVDLRPHFKVDVARLTLE